jgi:Tol biopolymer transport system component
MKRSVSLGLAVAATVAMLVLGNGCEAPETTGIRDDLSFSKAPMVYAASHDNNLEIFTMKGDGSGLANVSDHPGQDRDATFAPGAESIIFVSDRDGNSEIYRMLTDGSNVTRLTNNPAEDSYPSVDSSGGIYFSSLRDGMNPQVYRMLPDGMNPYRVSLHDDVAYNDPVADHSATRIAFSTTKDGQPGIFILTGPLSLPEKRTETRLTTGDDTNPAFSPDNTYIAFIRRVNSNPDIYIMKNDGTGVERLTNTAANEDGPWFSPDGKSLVFSSDINGTDSYDFDLYALDIATKQITRLTTTPAGEWRPRFAPYFSDAN